MKFIMLIGLPGSGKSTWANAQENAVVVSSDSIRKELFGDEDEQSKNDIVFNTMYKREVEALNERKVVICDATNLASKRRRNIIKELKSKVPSDTYFECIVFAVPYEICCERNSLRHRVVPDDAMQRMLKSFQPPHYTEGWNSIRVIGGGLGKAFLESIVNETVSMSHDNPHHEYTVGNHMLSAGKRARDLCAEMDVITAASFHDIGKKYTKAFFDARGNASEVAHFYNHENVGAYLYMLSLPEGTVNKQEQDIAWLILHHMDSFKGNSYMEKIKKTVPEELWKKLEIVHQCDLDAH